MADKPSYEELAKLLKDSNEALTKANADLETAQGAIEKLNANLTGALNEVATLRKGLSLSRTADMSDEIRTMVQEKMAAGLTEQQAIECAFRQASHNENLAKARKKPAAATQQPPRR